MIVSCEEIVPAATLRKDPNQNMLPPFMVDAVVHAPMGAHPTACHFFYDYDPAHMRMYGRLAPDDDLFKKYLDEWVYGPADQDAYTGRIDPDQLRAIQADHDLGYAPGLDRR